MRFTPNSLTLGKPINLFVADDVQKHQIGTRSPGVSYDYSATAGVPNGLGVEAIYAKAAGTFATGRLVHLDKDGFLLDVPVTAGTGRPFYVCMSSFSATAPFGWVARSGVVPVAFSVAATAGPVFGGTAGVATPTAAAGRQLLNATTLIAASATFTKTARTLNGSPFITVADVGGVYPGIAISGTGIPGGTTVLSIDPDGRTLRLSANATAGGSVTATFTHTGFGIVQIEQPFVQGQIT